jgi:hypothetical protein
MPDGDKVHKGLSWKYQKVYKQICDGQFRSDKLADEVVSAVGKDIQCGGDELIQLLQKVAEQCQQILDKRMFEQIDWQKEFARVDKLAQPICASRRLKALAVEACKETLQDLRNGGKPSKCYIELLTKYLCNIYEAQFAERVPLSPSHYQNVSRGFVAERLEAMWPFVKGQLLKYAEQIYRHGSVRIAGQPRRSARRKPNYDIDTDISTLGA